MAKAPHAGRLEGIEWLRAIMSIFVVAWHLGGGGKSLIWTDQFARHVYTASDFVNFQILLLAVPTFMLISNYLLARSNPDGATAWRRAKRVMALLLFWPVTLTIYQGGWTNVAANLPGTPQGWLIYVLTGAQSVYYFFVSLLITFALTFFANRLPLTANVGLLAASTLLTGLAPIASRTYGWPLLSAYWSPVNFLPFAFAGIVVHRLFGPQSSSARALLAAGALLIAGAALAVVEWQSYPDAVFFPGQGYAFPAHTRASLVAGAMAILILALRWRGGVPAPVEFMAHYSLALYCLHLFVAEPMRAAVMSAAPGLPPFGQTWLLIVLTIAVSYLAARLLSLVWKDQLLF